MDKAGILSWHIRQKSQDDAVTVSVRCHNVASTFIWRHFGIVHAGELNFCVLYNRPDSFEGKYALFEKGNFLICHCVPNSFFIYCNPGDVLTCSQMALYIFRLSRALFFLKFYITRHKTGPEVIKLFLCSTQHSMKFFLLINVKMATTVGILTVMSRKNSILSLSEPKKLNFLIFLYL